jgi:hypothetical protein
MFKLEMYFTKFDKSLQNNAMNAFFQLMLHIGLENEISAMWKSEYDLARFKDYVLNFCAYITNQTSRGEPATWTMNIFCIIVGLASIFRGPKLINFLINRDSRKRKQFTMPLV